ncbi:hypothetical protein H9635_08625 [Solibacillus sp. A46]|uniref:Lipoprotein n=1 Tax=Solibacillus faecavium TaxID=2762221 RepID=A0ABR8XY03_9BACL|nr:hypothetical protein [Solibacillus faecavium]MBD8036805.1 hypothetical protein [Solibacillus faecavium]
MKKILLALLFVMLIVGCSQKVLTLDDELLFELQDINDEEFQLLRAKTSNFTEEEIKQNYATIVLDYHVRNGKKFDNLTVQYKNGFGNLMEQVKYEDGLKFMNGDGRTSNYRNGSFERNTDRLVFYVKDFTDAQLQAIFNEFMLEVSWENDDGQWENKTIPVGEAFLDKRGSK